MQDSGSLSHLFICDRLLTIDWKEGSETKCEILSLVQLLLDVVLLLLLAVVGEVLDGVGRGRTAGRGRAQGGNGRREKIFLSPDRLRL